MFNPIAAIIIPNCLSVDRAIIFFMSHSVVALNPAIRVVETATNNNRGENHHEVDIKSKNRISKNTPAVTNVEE
jgi:hypothetical protein